ncbi:MAG TPA: hypothetical protein VMB21_17880 [Candidatus Limnocylindria bacterium]|nr:hypothetical protein [Candidatus Limnocylindria bacterium]
MNKKSGKPTKRAAGTTVTVLILVVFTVLFAVVAKRALAARTDRRIRQEVEHFRPLTAALKQASGAAGSFPISWKVLEPYVEPKYLSQHPQIASELAFVTNSTPVYDDTKMSVVLVVAKSPWKHPYRGDGHWAIVKNEGVIMVHFLNKAFLLENKAVLPALSE